MYARSRGDGCNIITVYGLCQPGFFRLCWIVVRSSLFVLREGVPLTGHNYIWGFCTGGSLESFIRYDGLSQMRYSWVSLTTTCPGSVSFEISGYGMRGVGRWRPFGRNFYILPSALTSFLCRFPIYTHCLISGNTFPISPITPKSFPIFPKQKSFLYKFPI